MGSWVELSKSAIDHNIKQLATIVEQTGGSALRLGLVVKGNAYGHGLPEIVDLTKSYEAVKIYLVASLAEALIVRRSGAKKRVISMVADDLELFSEAIAHDVEIACYDQQILALVAERARATKTTAKIHIKVDTGLGRLGIMPEEAPAVCDFLRAHQEVYLVGIMSHFSDIVSEELPFAEEQQRRFEAVCKVFCDAGFVCEKHIASSGAIQFAGSDSLIRAGSALYGFWKSESQRARYLKRYSGLQEWRPIATWKSRIMHIKKLPVGVGVGYGQSFVTKRPTILGIIPVGYIDGYMRMLAGGQVGIQGKTVPLLGKVSMNMISVDLTDVPRTTVGDEVTLIGDLPGIRVIDFATRMNTVTIEVMRLIGSSVPRVIVA